MAEDRPKPQEPDVDVAAGLPPAEEPAAQAEPAAAVSPEQVAALREEVERYRQEAERNWQQFLHAAADLENYKKAAARMQQEAVERTRRQMLLVLLSAVDDLERAIQYAERAAEGESAAGILDGLRMTHRSLLDNLRSLGVEPMPAAGERFDPARHEAVAVASAEEAGAEPGTVLEVVQQGYVWNGRVLRPARVRVAQ
jgi:molecular chaperone GrpE